MILLDPTLAFLGISAVLLAVSVTLSLMLQKHPSASRVLTLVIAGSIAALLGLAFVRVVEGPTVAPSALAAIAASHRRLLFLLPLILQTTALIVVSSRHENLSDKSGREYRNAAFLCSGLSLIAVIVIAIESVA
ncbi:hypothetical protein EBS80_02540 [bacterium]|nr:hypothetical protein [bacterium]